MVRHELAREREAIPRVKVADKEYGRTPGVARLQHLFAITVVLLHGVEGS